ncbi:MAG TPA: CSLREA domain-containing protein [Chloroflexi bacterium]|nr:CSLREA domain-containing protein [Chloroflexota bacterium]
MRKRVLTVTGLVLILCLVAPPTSAVREPNRFLQGADYVVNSTADPGIGTCDETECTLREAITAANGDGKVSNIAFDIPASDGGYNSSTGVWTIYLASALPALTEEGTGVMGSTQTGNRGDTNPYGPEIEISGQSLSPGAICWWIGSNTTIDRLTINGCPAYGLQVHGDDNTIVGNYIGTDATGSSDVSTSYNGILLGPGAENNTIGGPNEEDRNVISGMGGGICIFGSASSANVIRGNYIGTDRTGTQPLGNDGSGISIQDGAHDNTVGPNNVIAYNGGHGVSIGGSETIYNTVTQNSIHSNVGKGITLSDGANGNLAAPYDLVAICSAGSASSGGSLTWEAFSDFDEEGRFFESTGGTASGLFAFFPADVLFRYPYVTLTVTDASGNTSEFSAAVPSGCLFVYLPLSMKGY